MNKILIAASVFAILLWGCDSIPDGVVDSGTGEVEVVGSFSPTSVVYTDENTSITAQVEVSETSVVEKMWFNIVTNDGQLTIASNVAMKDNGEEQYGDNTANDYVYTGKYFLSDQNPNGDYSIEIYIRSGAGNSKKVAVNKFNYNNAQDNIAPVISDLNIPDAALRGEQIIFSLKAVDENGQADIQKVYYELFRPNGEQVENSQGVTKFPMFDDGNTENNGDETAGDTIYTVGLTFPETIETGDWKFVFHAIDRGGKTSNEITHAMVIQ